MSLGLGFLRRPEPASLSVGKARFSVTRLADGRWLVEGGRSRRSAEFDGLRAAIAYARRDCRAGEAIIELRADGLYVLVQQAIGWPNDIVAGCG